MRLPLPTPDGEFVATYSEGGLCGLNFPSRGALEAPHGAYPQEVPAPIVRWHSLVAEALAQALAGRPLRELPPLDLSQGTEFQREVWEALRRIPCGQTLSYAGVAQAIGRPKAVRAVGGACGANPVPVLIPCHRVLASGNKLGGFSGELEWKRRLLSRENISFF
jgi:O-6-methylguanine DNA methyltransferase